MSNTDYEEAGKALALDFCSDPRVVEGMIAIGWLVRKTFNIDKELNKVSFGESYNEKDFDR